MDERCVSHERAPRAHPAAGGRTRSRPSGSARGSWPGQATTGMRGYFGNAGSLFDRRHIENTDPRVLRTSF